jgi:phosphomannomutase
MDDVERRTLAWIAADPDERTRAELTRLLEAGELDELADRMNGTLTFGTAGIRGVVEGGSNRMNRAGVIRTTAGLAAHLLATTDPNDRLIAIGRDARPSSAAFMADTVGVLLAAGFTVRFFADPTPTPLVAYAGLKYRACASIVITASHNPPADNGYKVFGGGGVQIVAPTDSEIAARIEAVGPANEVPRLTEPYEDARAEAIDAELFESYLRDVSVSLPGVAGDRSLSIVYSAMHGVGGRFVTEALRRFGFGSVTPVARQYSPDGAFPTVSFPNPEEPGALDMAHELAEAVDADLVMANDPDTDRLAVSVPDPGGVWRPLTGNQIGCLLAEFLLSHDADVSKGIVVNSVVSSPLLGAIAAAHGATWDRSLTGFKWIWNAALDLQDAGKGRLVLGYEEALGYSVGTTVRDKDGISAALAFAIMAADAKGKSKTTLDCLGDLYRRYGVAVSSQVSIRMEGPDGPQRITEAMSALRGNPPDEIGAFKVEGVTDFLDGAQDRPRYMAATNLIELDLGEAGRVLARPSGTEPKLKIYVDLSAPFPDSGDWLGAEARLTDTARGTGDALAAWLHNAVSP